LERRDRQEVVEIFIIPGVWPGATTAMAGEINAEIVREEVIKALASELSIPIRLGEYPQSLASVLEGMLSDVGFAIDSVQKLGATHYLASDEAEPLCKSLASIELYIKATINLADRFCPREEPDSYHGTLG
jgi:hypothetical protein